jgi:hypothetical protein
MEKIFLYFNNYDAESLHDRSPENLDSYVFLGKIFLKSCLPQNHFCGTLFGNRVGRAFHSVPAWFFLLDLLLQLNKVAWQLGSMDIWLLSSMELVLLIKIKMVFKSFK